MKFKKEKWINYLMIFLVSAISCTNPIGTDNSTPSQNTEKPETSKKDDCNCSDANAEALANKIVNDFTQTQDQLTSDEARVMSTYKRPEKRDNCTWVVTFKISWPFGNTDGAHPDEFVEKHLACDGKELYVQ